MNMWNQLLKFKDFIIEHMNDIGENYIEPEMEEFNQKDWINLTWKTKDFRRCHLDVVDVRKSKKLWMMHFWILVKKWEMIYLHRAQSLIFWV